MNRQDLEAYIKDTYGVLADYPFEDDNSTAVFRHSSNKKWFALMMTVPKSRFGLSDAGMLDVVNLKCAPDMIDSFWCERGIFPAYHMNKKHWISVSLDGSVDDETVRFLMGVSHTLTDKKKKL